MSPSSSIPQHPSINRVSHSRNPSGAATPLKPSPEPSQPSKPPVHYTLFIRLPFPRGSFQDPSQVFWDASKDKQLWKLISKASNSRDLDWPTIAERFEVDLDFLLQQAAWLYERHFASMKAQMKKLGTSAAPSTTPPTAPGPVPGSDSAGSSTADVVRRTGNRDPKVLSAISMRTDSPLPVGELSMPSTPRRSQALSRSPSSTTVTQSKVASTAPAQPPPIRAFRTLGGSHRRPPPPVQEAGDFQDDEDGSPEGEHDRSESESSESEDDHPTMARSQAFRKPVAGAKKPTLGTLSSDGEGEDDADNSSGGFLPFAGSSKSKEDPSATLRSSPKRSNVLPATSDAGKGNAKTNAPDSSSASETSATAPSRPWKASDGRSPGAAQGPPTRPLSPKRVAALSPRMKRDGSDGTLSMGSSFSDLDDASVSLSALEAALLSNIQGGRSGSRMSSISNALKSKYM